MQERLGAYTPYTPGVGEGVGHLAALRKALADSVSVGGSEEAEGEVNVVALSSCNGPRDSRCSRNAGSGT